MPIAFAVKSSHHLSPFCCYVCLSVCVLDVRVKNKKKESRVLNYLSINLRCVVCVCVIVLYFLNGMAAVLCCAVPCVFVCGLFLFLRLVHTHKRPTDRPTCSLRWSARMERVYSSETFIDYIFPPFTRLVRTAAAAAAADNDVAVK